MNNEYVYAEKQVGPYTVKVVQDIEPETPRAWDNFGHMICFHRRYNLGDKHNMSVEEVQDLMKDKNVFYLNLYLYDHSGITMSTGSFNDPWDSGQVGIIYVTKDEVREEYGKKVISAKLKKQVYEMLESEVKTYDNYLTGEVYGFVVEDEDENHIDSCYGFYGEVDYCLSEGIFNAEWNIKQDISNHLKKLRAWIKSGTPLMHRKPCPIKK